MRILRFFGLLPIVFMLFFAQSNLSSCQKEMEIVRDTIILKDTLFLKDTIRITDTVSCYNLMDSLVAYYNFNGGNLNDSSGNNNHIIFNNAAKTPDRFGRANNAYKFDGITSFMRVANSASLNPKKISLVAMVKFTGFYHGACHGNQILKKGFQDQNDGIYGLRAGVLGIPCANPVDTTVEQIFGYYGNNQFSSIGVVDSIDYIKPNIWMTIVFTYDGTQGKMYIDGKLKQTINGVVPFTPNNFDMLIGRAEHPQYPYWFKGVIDELRVYKRALCEGEVKEISKLKN
ncbi:MAG: LamG domain-containing protein [Chitinophagaceae bacterium]|nr:LamG domain-containing protein [Chitinophagaceae bacterium]